jgi:hypothetical protein
MQEIAKITKTKFQFALDVNSRKSRNYLSAKSFGVFGKKK